VQKECRRDSPFPSGPPLSDFHNAGMCSHNERDRPPASRPISTGIPEPCEDCALRQQNVRSDVLGQGDQQSLGTCAELDLCFVYDYIFACSHFSISQRYIGDLAQNLCILTYVKRFPCHVSRRSSCAELFSPHCDGLLKYRCQKCLHRFAC
jgi:hypothetical protein